MNWRDAQLALRHGCRIVAAPPFLALIGLITLLGSLTDRTGPAGLAMAQGFAVHLVRNLVSAVMGTLAVVLVARIVTQRLGLLPRLALAGVVAAPLVHATAVAGAALAQRGWPTWAFAPWSLARDAIVVSAIAVVVGLFRSDLGQPAPHPAPPPAVQPPAPSPPSDISPPPPLLRRLPAHLGPDLLRVSACDHYVEVQTQNGTALILLRLADAVKELAGVPGMQIHRSHWVAHPAMAAVEVEQRRPQLVMTNGQRLPISRARLAQVRAALKESAIR